MAEGQHQWFDESPVSRLELAIELRQAVEDLAEERRANRKARHALLALGPRYGELRHAVLMMQTSKFWWLRQRWFDLKKLIGLAAEGATRPVNPPPFEMLGDASDYERWRIDNAWRDSDRGWMQEVADLLPSRPCIDLLSLAGDAPDECLNEMLDSVVGQLYGNWRLFVLHRGAAASGADRILSEYAAQEPRIILDASERTTSTAAALNAALARSEGDFVGVLGAGDRLTPDALLHVALLSNSQPKVDVIYTDEDSIDERGRLASPFFKPDWSPDRLLGQFYTGNLTVYRRSLVAGGGGFREGFEGAEKYDLALRLTERTDQIAHVPRVLYHSRDSGPESCIAERHAGAMAAIAEAVERRGEQGRVYPVPGLVDAYVVRYLVRKPERVSIIVPTRDHGSDVERCFNSIFGLTRYDDFEVVLVDNSSTDRKSLEIFADWQRSEPERLKIIRYEAPFNFSKINNFAVREAATGQYLLFLNNDTRVVSEDWLSAMVEQAQRPAIGAVGAKLLYDDDTIQHAGVLLGVGDIAAHAHRYFDKDDPGYFHSLQIVTNYSAVTAACLMLRKAVFEEAGGFDDALGVAYNDVDLCMRIHRRGYRIVYLPHVVLYHYESKSRGSDYGRRNIARYRSEVELMERRWSFSTINDPYYNRNLTRVKEDFSLR